MSAEPYSLREKAALLLLLGFLFYVWVAREAGSHSFVPCVSSVPAAESDLSATMFKPVIKTNKGPFPEFLKCLRSSR